MNRFNHIKIDYKPIELKVVETNGFRFYYDPQKTPHEYYPSVTTVLKDYKKDVLDQWIKRVGIEEAERISKQARERGNIFHTLNELYLRNEDPNIFLKDYSKKERLLFQQARPFLTKHINNIYFQEQMISSDILGVAGRIDLIAEYDGVLSVVDFKGSNKIKKEEWIDSYFMQGSAYAFSFWERTKILPKQVVIIIASDDFVTKAYIKQSHEFLPMFKKQVKIFNENLNVEQL